MCNRVAGALAALALLAPMPGAAQEPMAAIEWLEEMTRAPMERAPGPMGREPPIARSAGVPDIAVSPLGALSPDAVGLLPTNVTGFPATLWQASATRTLIDLIAAQRVEGQPAMQALLYSLLLAEAAPPADAGPEARLLLARIDKLHALGAVEPALALVERAGPSSPALAARWFDLALLAGDPAAACGGLERHAAAAPDYGARVFCLARQGRWDSASATLEAAAVLDALTPVEADLLRRFLDPEALAAPELPPGPQPDALDYRLREAIGAPLPPSALPRPFSVAALSGDLGWKAQLDAAERLARMGAISENRLIGIYMRHQPAASGGVWDRIAAVQRLDAMLETGEVAALGAALPPAWRAMRDADLAVPFARLFGARLAALSLDGAAGRIAFSAGLLSPDYEAVARGRVPDTDEARFLAALAEGRPARVAAPSSRAQAVTRGFDRAPPDALARQLSEGRLGEAILRAMALYSAGIAGDLPDLADALATLRAVGLEDTARQAALQAMLLAPAR